MSPAPECQRQWHWRGRWTCSGGFTDQEYTLTLPGLCTQSSESFCKPDPAGDSGQFVITTSVWNFPVLNSCRRLPSGTTAITCHIPVVSLAFLLGQLDLTDTGIFLEAFEVMNYLLEFNRTLKALSLSWNRVGTDSCHHASLLPRCFVHFRAHGRIQLGEYLWPVHPPLVVIIRFSASL